MASFLTLSFVLVAGLCTVYGGTSATIEDYPSVVQVEFGGALVGAQICSGVIVTNRHILSAARCFSGPLFNPRTRRVRAGATRRGLGGTIFRVESVANHPSFGTNQHEGDISIVRLATNVVYGATIDRAPIIAQDFVLPASLPVAYAGWGRTAQETIWPNLSLHTVEMHIVREEECVSKYASLPVPVSITSDMMCAGIAPENGISHDVRDGGGPIFYEGIVVGVVSIGLPVLDDYPLVATSVAAYSNWILQTAV